MSYPNWVAANVAAGLQDLVATLESIASAHALDPGRYAAFRMNVATGPALSASVAAPTAPVAGLGNAMIALYNAIPVLVADTTGVDPSVAAGLFALVGGLCAAMAPADAMAAFAAAADALPDAAPAPSWTANRLADAANAQILARLSRGALLAGYAQGLVGVDFPARPQAVTARADCVERFEREIDLCQGWPDALFAAGLARLRDCCVAYLSQAIINLKPIIFPGANLNLPSLWWAQRLYGQIGGDVAAMAADLIARNDVAHASYMPVRFEALAP